MLSAAQKLAPQGVDFSALSPNVNELKACHVHGLVHRVYKLSTKGERGAGATQTNAAMTPRQVRRFCALPAEGERLLATTMSRLGLSDRGHDGVLPVASTIAVLEGADALCAEHERKEFTIAASTVAAVTEDFVERSFV